MLRPSPDRPMNSFWSSLLPDFRESALLDQIPADHLEFSSHSHDIDLCAAGAARARGKYLLFTEAHCWPEPDLLERCLEAINANPDWAGSPCLSIPITHNRLSRAEARMYMSDIEYAMEVHPWRKILDQCFVTDREAYERCGGFKTGIGHYAEWLLAASYFQRGYKIGYFTKARFHHYYSGSLAELKAFTLDFVSGEFNHLGGERDDSISRLFEIPSEWICQGNFDRDRARAVLHIALQGLWPPSISYRYLPWSIAEIGRWISSRNVRRWDGPGLCGSCCSIRTSSSNAGDRDRFAEATRQSIGQLCCEADTCSKACNGRNAASGKPRHDTAWPYRIWG